MQYFTDSDIRLNKPTAITIGKFDGLHLGHQQLIQNIKTYASNNHLFSAVLSFYPHPGQVFNAGGEHKLILSRDEKIRVLETFGVDMYIEYPFTEDFFGMEPNFFVEEILVNRLKCKYLTVGTGYCFGKQKKGTIKLLETLACQHDITLEIIPDVIYKDNIVSSTLIKTLILSDEFVLPKKLMAKHYFVSGEVVLGKQIGRTIGTPTVNIYVDDNKLTPNDGVYTTYVYYKKNRYKSITNIGTNPTMANNGCRTIESHLLDFNEDIYGHTIEIEFLHKIRDEIKFCSIQELMHQIQKDKQIMENYFQNKILQGELV